MTMLRTRGGEAKKARENQHSQLHWAHPTHFYSTYRTLFSTQSSDFKNRHCIAMHHLQYYSDSYEILLLTFKFQPSRSKRVRVFFRVCVVFKSLMPAHFFNCWRILHCMIIQHLFIHLPVEGQLNWFAVIKNETDINIHGQAFVWAYVFVSLG